MVTIGYRVAVRTRSKSAIVAQIESGMRPRRVGNITALV